MAKCLKCGVENAAACEGDHIGLIGCLDRQVEILGRSLENTRNDLHEVTTLLRDANAAAGEYRDHRDMAERQRNELRSENEDLLRQLAQRDSRIAELEAALRVERLLGDEARAYVKSVDEKLPGYVDGLRARIAELEAKLAAGARLAQDSAEAAGEMVGDYRGGDPTGGRR